MNNEELVMGRGIARQAVVQFLVQLDFRCDSFEDNLEKFTGFLADDDELDADIVNDEYFLKVSKGVYSQKNELDKRITGFMRKDWSIDRINKVVAAILEVSFYEILNCEDIPDSVSINEAVKLTKRFADTKDYAFVNGILSSLEKSL